MTTNVVYKFLSNFVQCACVIHCIYEYIGDIVVRDTSQCMDEYQQRKQNTKRISVRLQKLKIGDIIISKCPSNPKQHICKRVAGLPGDKVQHGIVVPNGHVWLEGDNSDNSTDSRVYGPVPQGLLRGRAICKILPLKDITFFVTEHMNSD